MKILLLGSGGREHALAWKLAQDPRVETVFVAPGNAGSATEAKCRNVALDILDNAALVAFAQAENIALTVVGPEAPLVNGVVNAFRAAGLKIWGPTQHAAQLEGSKALPKISSHARTSLPRFTKSLPAPMLPSPMFARKVLPSSSRLMAWLPAKASSSP